MTSVLRFCSWLLVPVLAFCSLAVMAEPIDGAAQALHLLGYLGADYPATVANGQVIDSGEYREQLEFLTVLQGLIVALPARNEQAELQQGVASLRQGIEGRVDGGQVALQARQLAATLASAYGVSQTPAITPDPSRGAALQRVPRRQRRG